METVPTNGFALGVSFVVIFIFLVWIWLLLNPGSELYNGVERMASSVLPVETHNHIFGKYDRVPS